MRKQKDLKACIILLQELQGRGSIEPQQKKAVEYAIDEIKRMRRKSNPKQNEIHESIRCIVETLISAFINRE
jgi:hypothetical protein